MCIIKAASHRLAFLPSNKKRSWPLDTWEQSLQLQSQAQRGRCWSEFAPRLPLQQPEGLADGRAASESRKNKKQPKPGQPGSARAGIQHTLVSWELQNVLREDGGVERA